MKTNQNLITFVNTRDMEISWIFVWILFTVCVKLLVINANVGARFNQNSMNMKCKIR